MGVLADKTGKHTLLAKITLPFPAICYTACIFVVKNNNATMIMVLCAFMGLFTFALLPLALELSVEGFNPFSSLFTKPNPF